MSEQATRRDLTIGVITIVVTLIGWTVTPLFIEYFTTDIDAWTSNGWRYGFAALCWAPLLISLWLRGKFPPGLWKAALIPAALNAGAQVAFTTSFYEIDPGLVAFGLRSQMVFTAVGAAVLFAAERAVIRNPLFLVGMLAVMAGTGYALIGEALRSGESDAAAKISILGGVLALTAGAGFACYALAVRKCMNHLGSMVSFAAISQLTAVVQIVLMLLLARDLETGVRDFGAGVLGLSGEKLFYLALSAVIGIALGHVFYYVSIRRLGVTVSTGVIQLQPFTVAALSLAVFNEHLTIGQWITGTIAVGGAVLMLLAQQRVLRRIRSERDLVRALEEETDPHG